ncbi:hypothetical protein TrispH2_008082 [Trichoplax sp. H2]|nr:hypothetical protein TrispH2_008082 [Trichoplax sp. H2]|eukprot:RDD39744.1 hypothetical protein TrispH2_008082 [Trichoplax sp. H2]
MDSGIKTDIYLDCHFKLPIENTVLRRAKSPFRKNLKSKEKNMKNKEIEQCSLLDEKREVLARGTFPIRPFFASHVIYCRIPHIKEKTSKVVSSII